MRPKISWSDLRGERVAVWGMGVEGGASVRKLISLGVDHVLVDDRPEPGAEPFVLPTAGPGLEAMLGCAVVIKTPGISRYRPEVAELEDAGVPVVGGLGLWLEEVDRDRVVCVTGTKGKSTTTSIAAHLATGLGRRAVAGGNLGLPPYDPEAPIDVDLWVVEVSSYQATDVASSPPVVVVTSLAPDHLPWHGDVATYVRDKLSLTTQPGARLTVASAASPLLVDEAQHLGPDVRWVDTDTYDPRWAEPLHLLGGHNLVNANLARAALEAIGVDGASDHDAVQAAAEGFAGLDSRLQHVDTIDGVDFVDDSLSTNVGSTLAAVDAFPDRRIALIAGGFDRDLDYRPLAEGLARRDLRTHVLTVYTTGPRIQAALADAPSPLVSTAAVDDLAAAVRRAAAWARPDGVVLLSPAAASFDAFVDYRDRAAAFRAAVAQLRRTGPDA